jgi:hypothetical protein
VLENSIEMLEHLHALQRAEAALAFGFQAQVIVDMPIFMVATQKSYSMWMRDLQAQQ